METVVDATFVNGGPAAMVLGRFGIMGVGDWFNAAAGTSGFAGTCCELGLLSVAVGPAARRIAAIGLNEVSIRDLVENRIIPLRNPGLVSDAVFSPNEECVLTIPSDGKIRLWEAKSGRQMIEFAAKAGSASRAAFSDDGRTVVVGTGDTAQIFATDVCANVDAMMRAARPRIVRPLRPDERRRFLHENAAQ
jgi:WD40 repeat protein